jgi:hypothetical protein
LVGADAGLLRPCHRPVLGIRADAALIARPAFPASSAPPSGAWGRLFERGLHG